MRPQYYDIRLRATALPAGRAIGVEVLLVVRPPARAHPDFAVRQHAIPIPVVPKVNEAGENVIMLPVPVRLVV